MNDNRSNEKKQLNRRSTRRRGKHLKRINKKKAAIMIGAAVIIIAAVLSIFFIGRPGSEKSRDTKDLQQTIAPSAETNMTTPTIPPTAAPTPTPLPTPVPTPTPAPVQRRGTAQPIPPDIQDYMTGLSYRENNNISISDLSYLTIPYYDFNYNIQYGHMVVNNSVAEDVLDIFAELFDIKYPIERMELVDKYNASDFESIEYNNTSSFNYRESTDGSGKLSKHAYGLAIDINPQINPYVSANGTGAHENAREYWNRDVSGWSSDIAKAAYIGTDTEIYRIFTAHGWRWGGSWTSYRDYQHFEK